MTKDYSGQNLQGRSFKGQNLEGANFSGADIKSADFTGANLKGTNFSHATAGLQRRWAIFLVCISFLLSGISGFFSALMGGIIAFLFNSGFDEFSAWTSLIVVIVIFILILHQGLNSAVAGAIAIGVTVAGVGAFAYRITVPLVGDVALVDTFTVTVPLIGAIAGAIIGAIAVAIVYGRAGACTIAAAIIGVGAGAITGAIAGTEAYARAGAGASYGSGVGAVVGVILSIYIARRAIKGDEKYSLVRNIAVAFAAIGGTSFRNADLTNANFTGATLKSTDLRNATLTRTCFSQTKLLNRVRLGKTYLQNAQLRQLLITGQGQDKNFDRQDLGRVHLQGANLKDASFIGADLSEANLQDADLSRVKLVQTQLDGTDFTGATLTGAYIQDWGITTDTKFDGVRCEYVYMRLPTKENPDPLRKPDNNKEVFADGDFADFIQPIFDTLDLYHNQGVDPRAIAIAFKQLAENNPDAELEIVAMEKRGSDKFLLRAKTAATADKSELSAEYFDTYNYLKHLPPEEQIKHFLTELKIKDNQINLQTNQILSYTNMISAALGRPSIQAENYNNHGDTMSQSPKKQSTYNLQNAQFGGGLVDADTVNAEQIGGNISNYTTEQKQNLAQAAAEIQQLLTQLEQTNPTTTSAQKMAVVAKAVDEIEKNPTLKARVVGALKSGGTEALKEALDHPLVNVFIAAVEGWQDAN